MPILKREVHVSDIKTYLKCRRQHWFSSPHLRNLEPITPYLPFFFGRAAHEALQAKYETGVSAVQVFTDWTEKELARIPLFGDLEEKFRKEVSLGVAMLEHYETWQHLQSKEFKVRYRTELRNCDENLDFLALELSSDKLGVVPITWQVRREWVSGRGPVVSVHPDITFGYRLDGVVRRKSDNTYWIWETKTARSIDELKRSLDFDIQSTMYAWAAQTLLRVPVAGVLYNKLRKKAPTVPKILKSTLEVPVLPEYWPVVFPSEAIESLRELTPDQYPTIPMPLLSADKLEDSTIAVYITELHNIALELSRGRGQECYSMFRDMLHIAHRDVLERLWTIDSNPYFERFEVRRTQLELQLCAENFATVAQEMLHSSTPRYPAPSWSTCTYCSFKQPCLSMNRGASAEGLLQDAYRVRETWTESE